MGMIAGLSHGMNVPGKLGISSGWLRDSGCSLEGEVRLD